MPLLEQVFARARAVAPGQPLTAGVWIGNRERRRVVIESPADCAYFLTRVGWHGW